MSEQNTPATPEALVFKLAERMIQLASVAAEAEKVILDVRGEMKQILQAMDVLVKPAENKEKSNEESNQGSDEEKGREELGNQEESAQADQAHGEVEVAPV